MSHPIIERFSRSKYSPDPRDVIWTVPNVISFLRILSIPVIAYLVARRHLIIALVVLLVSALSDGVDGIIARRFNQVSKLGQILDPIADRLLILCSVLALSIANILPWWLLILVGLRDVLMGLQVLLLAQHDYGPLPVHFAGKTGTAVLMLAIPALILADAWRTHFFQVLHLVALGAVIWGVGLYWLAGLIYARQGFGLLKEDSRS
ncbi:CDP-diacylglycerol--glycerol-3-phosphate 3-phosphatidyltransferase [Bifidobacterium actinocoloniiforme DSM 22766]|uniref:CDP-diacylglycerol--glycerol-3-phosphate 3-phosphatidyltransferase n=1 Tax=Bifidobacterium actinocoloniiforme DSM 22766 TaxID=1437605 RepID=A0A086Z0D0_9BIFI|nr:CDP-alcohol phosphatidyltransferase family protein [Bifidobacterium actinocoloniiforme]AKV55225.1 CDP-diacylglycerol--glycerol-3-phosphate 3-phosphatidyltransferase [Bifidobacterium actinocoloniiforme DSM 22766]KFI39980.1 CDP-diacylglycerol--glycerol-3-phosphate 3-phosphatidyltransferase [Bifidobacterium actinocoloniiforme DSM 22766]